MSMWEAHSKPARAAADIVVTPLAACYTSIKRILGGASSVAIGVAELRNQSGTGHGQGRPRTGLGQRHAHLAVNAAFMRCQLMLDTLADPIAPWRKQAAAGGRTTQVPASSSLIHLMRTEQFNHG